MKCLSFVLLFLYCTAMYHLHAQHTIDLVHRDQNNPLYKSLGYFTDSSGDLDINQIKTLRSSGKFKYEINGYHNFGINPSNHWFYLSILNNNVRRELIIDLPDSYLEEIELYILKENKLYYHVHTNGWRTPINERPISSYHHAFPINLKEAGIYDIYIKIRRATGTVKGTILLETKEHYFRNYIFENHISSLVQGAILLLCLFGFFLFVQTSDRLYLWYCLQNIALFLFIAARHGVLNFYLLGIADKFAGNYSNYLCALLYAAAHLSFVINFLQVKELIGRVGYNFALWLIAFSLVLLLMLNVAGSAAIRFYLMYTCIIAASLLVLLIIIVGLMRNGKNVRIYALAQAPFLALILYYMTGLFLTVPVNWITLHGLQFGPLFEVTVLAVALAERFSGFQRQNLHLLNNLNESQTQMIKIQDIERQRIAQDLHDELGGNLAAIKMSLQSSRFDKKEVSPIIKLIDQISLSARNIAHNLMPPEFEKVELIELLKGHFISLNLDSKTKFYFHNSNYDSLHFTKQQELTIYRIFIESVNNIIKHADANEATIQLIGYERYLELVIEDDGQGFIQKGTVGIGLKSIESRVSILNGELNIDSGEAGTTIVIRIPYKEKS